MHFEFNIGTFLKYPIERMINRINDDKIIFSKDFFQIQNKNNDNNNEENKKIKIIGKEKNDIDDIINYIFNNNYKEIEKYNDIKRLIDFIKDKNETFKCLDNEKDRLKLLLIYLHLV